jgi:hypothetical protein
MLISGQKHASQIPHATKRDFYGVMRVCFVGSVREGETSRERVRERER